MCTWLVIKQKNVKLLPEKKKKKKNCAQRAPVVNIYAHQHWQHIPANAWVYSIAYFPVF